MIRREDQKGDTVTFNHTMAGTITSRNYRTKANSPSGTITDTDTFTFDAMGRMLTAVSGRYSNTVTMTYDNYGRLDDESLTIASQTYTVTRGYDSRGRLDELTYPNGSVVERTYTDRSQLHTVKYLGSTVDTRTYDDGGRLGTSTYANGAVITFSYRNDNLPSSIATSHAGSPNIGTYSYSWDENKNKTGETISGTMSGFGFSTGSTGYDDEDRLTAWERIDTNLDQAWTLSAVGNWNSFSSDSSTWSRTHSDAHEFTGFTGTSSGSLTYDVKGNQTSRPSTLAAPALNLEWNFDNQLIGADINGSSGSLEVNFEYDALGRRVARSASAGNVVYVHAGQQVIADYPRGTAASSPTYRYVYADYVDEPILRHSGTGTTLPGSGDDALFYHRNQQYSIIGLTNAAGTLVERYSYSSYGTLGIYDASGTVRTASTYGNRYTYTGREYDADLNLYHFRARWYDPAAGGFISRDPLGYVDGMSLYRGYFGVRGVDPYGMNQQDACYRRCMDNLPLVIRPGQEDSYCRGLCGIEPRDDDATCTIKLCSRPVPGPWIFGESHLFVLCGGDVFRAGPTISLDERRERDPDKECICNQVLLLGQLWSDYGKPWTDKPEDHPESDELPYDKEDMWCVDLLVARSCDDVCGCFKKLSKAVNDCCIPYAAAPVLRGPILGANSNSYVGWLLRDCAGGGGNVLPGEERFPKRRIHPGYTEPLPECVREKMAL